MLGRKTTSPNSRPITHSGQDDNAVGIQAILAAIGQLYPEQKNHIQTNALMKFW